MSTTKSVTSESVLRSIPSKLQIPLLVVTSLLFFLAILFFSTLSVKEVSERVPSRSNSVDESDREESEEHTTPRKKALYDPSDDEDDQEEDTKRSGSARKTPTRKSSRAKELGSAVTPQGRRSCRLQLTADKKKKQI